MLYCFLRTNTDFTISGRQLKTVFIDDQVMVCKITYTCWFDSHLQSGQIIYILCMMYSYRKKEVMLAYYA